MSILLSQNRIKINKLTLYDQGYPEALQHIAVPPEQLFVAGTPLAEIMARPRVAIVGSRKVSAYGREVTTQLARELAGRGIVIISGLAFGVDALAHQATLDVGGTTVAVLPGPVEKIYPVAHTRLAAQIIANGGTLVSEYPAGTEPLRCNFIARNRIVAGLSSILLITEAAERSGTLHTARFALEQGRDVLAVPGSIYSPTSAGTNNLIKTGATPVTSVDDVLHALGLGLSASGQGTAAPQGRTPEEQALLDLLQSGLRDTDALLVASNLSIAIFNQTLTMLEITGKIRSLGAGQWTIG